MTEKQYQRAVQINNRLKDLEKVKDTIKKTEKHRLWYAWKGESEWRLEPEWDMETISELLDKHDRMIREEIDKEIEQLKAEITTL